MSSQVTTSEGSGLPPHQKLGSLQKGDKIRINERKQPLTVHSIKQHEFDEGDTYMGTLEGPQGAEYGLVQSLKDPEIVTVRSRVTSSSTKSVRELEVLENER